MDTKREKLVAAFKEANSNYEEAYRIYTETFRADSSNLDESRHTLFECSRARDKAYWTVRAYDKRHKQSATPRSPL